MILNEDSNTVACKIGRSQKKANNRLFLFSYCTLSFRMQKNYLYFTKRFFFSESKKAQK